MQSTNRNNPEIIDKINNAINSISDTKNKVPDSLKRTFNFKGRKSIDIPKKIISKLTPKGSTVGDPFVGSGSFCIASIKAGMNFIGCELDNYTYDATRLLLQKCDLIKLEKLYTTIKEECYEKILAMYQTECCGITNYIKKLHFDPETQEYYNPIKHRDIIDGKNILLMQTCPVCGEKRKTFEAIDENKLIETRTIDTNRFPSHYLIENSRTNITSSSGNNKYDRNFINRSKAALLIIQDSINHLPSCNERDLLEHCLVASLALARIAQYGSGSEYIYQVMRNTAQEMNVWYLFESKYFNFLKYKKEIDSIQIDNITDENSPLQIYNCDYINIFDNDKYKEAFDVIYTDPPYTDQVPYLERSQLFRDWLRLFYDNKKFNLTKDMLKSEIVVSNAPSRPDKSNFNQYYNDIDKMFSTFYKSLKPNGIVVLTIKLGTKKYLKTLAEFITLARKNGFEYAIKLGVDQKNPTVRKQAARSNSISKEIIVFFTKLSSENIYWYIDNINYDFEIIKLIYNEIKSCGNAYLTLTQCVELIQKDLLRKYDIIADDKQTERIIKRIKSEFSITNSFVSIDSNKLYLELESSDDLFGKLYDTIPVIIKKLDTGKGFELDDLYFETINILLNGDANILNQILSNPTHESQIVNLLNSYCDESNGKYRIKQRINSKTETSQDISSMDGYAFEDLIKRLLDNQGYYDVIRIGGACDRGVDITAKKEIDGKEVGFIFQCKRWIGNVSGTPIQRLHSMMVQLSPFVSRAVCITTSDYTSEGKIQAANTGVEIINGENLLEQLNRAFPNEYYHALLELTD